jgi:cyclic-di-GMP-binding protein
MPSFDVVCRVALQEVDNAIQQTLREIGQRFDFKSQRTELRREDLALHLLAADEFKLRALGDILRERMARRQVPLRALQWGVMEPGPGGTAKQRIDLQEGIPGEQAREIVKLVKETKRKVQVAIQGDQVRVSGKSKDDLQAVVHLLRERDLGIAMQFSNLRD